MESEGDLGRRGEASNCYGITSKSYLPDSCVCHNHLDLRSLTSSKSRVMRGEGHTASKSVHSILEACNYHPWIASQMNESRVDCGRMGFHKMINVPTEMYGKFEIPPGYTSSHSTVNANVFKFLRISSKFVRSKHRYIYIPSHR